MRNDDFRHGSRLARAPAAALVDPLEARLVMSSISGTVYNDLNGNGHRDVGEPGLSGWVVYEARYVDATAAIIDVRTVTDAAGFYRLTYNFASLDRPVWAHVRVATPAGWQLTEPSAGEYLTPPYGPQLVYTGKNFGNRAIAAPAPTTPASLTQATPAPVAATGSFFASGSTTIADDVLALHPARTQNAAAVLS